MKKISLELIAVLFVIVVAFLLIFPTIVMYVNKTKEPEVWPNKKINLGLDLQGGMHLVLEVETEKALEREIVQLSIEIRRIVKKEHIRQLGIRSYKKNKISAKIKGKEHARKFEKLIKEKFAKLKIDFDQKDKDIFNYIIRFSEKDENTLKKMVTEQALEKIRNRIDEFGVREPDIRIQGDKRILIQLPGMYDRKRAKELIGRTALLEFRLVDTEHSLQIALDGNIPPGSEILYQYSKDSISGNTVKKPFLIKKRTLLTGNTLIDARVRVDSRDNSRYVLIQFDKKGARLFGRITGDNVGKPLAIILDEVVHFAPRINEKISSGLAQISGIFTQEEAHDLAIILRAGALPAPVKIIEERTVGPTLGKESIRQGLYSMLIGGLLVILFMLFYYRWAGLVANFGLFLTIILIGSGLSIFQATLTLPGIAGIILTIGMAVDANVIIFERIKEELLLGKSPKASIDAGFKRASLTILDANVTTLIASLVLFQFGTGPIKGFAVTLALGIFSSMFTALVVSRIIFNAYLKNKKISTLNIIKPSLNINFIEKRKVTFLISILIIIISIISLILHKGPKLGIDFAGGTLIQIKFKDPVKVTYIKKGLTNIQIISPTVQEFGKKEDNEYLLRISKTDIDGQDVLEKIKTELRSTIGQEPQIRRVEMVGPMVGKDLRGKALFAMFYTLLFITIYISGRFEFKWMLSAVMAGSLMSAVYFFNQFEVSIPFLITAALVVVIILFVILNLRYAMGAIIALLHDVLITVGIFSLIDLEFSLAIVAALLTIIGYSLNDTIIIFDRIRENLSKHSMKSLKENINISINETLSRTLLTSLTTLTVLIILYFFGGEIIHDFAFAMIIGVLIGTYSSIFVASPILLVCRKKIYSCD